MSYQTSDEYRVNTACMLCHACVSDHDKLHYSIVQSTLEAMWDLYAEYLPGSVPRVLMLSWAREYDYGECDR